MDACCTWLPAFSPSSRELTFPPGSPPFGSAPWATGGTRGPCWGPFGIYCTGLYSGICQPRSCSNAPPSVVRKLLPSARPGWTRGIAVLDEDYILGGSSLATNSLINTRSGSIEGQFQRRKRDSAFCFRHSGGPSLGMGRLWFKGNNPTQVGRVWHGPSFWAPPICFHGGVKM